MKRLLIFVLVVSLLGSGVYFLVNYLNKKKTEQKETEENNVTDENVSNSSGIETVISDDQNIKDVEQHEAETIR